MMDPALPQLFDRLWRALAEAAREGADTHPWRRLALATVDAAGAPQARYLILRDVDRAGLLLRVHTDVRSAKWAEIGARPRAALLGYDPATREQLRLAGQAIRFGPGTPEQAAAWRGLSAWARTTYCGGPPGHTIPAPEAPDWGEAPPDPARTADGERRFGLVEFAVRELEWYQHPRGAIRRAVFTCGDGGLSTAEWIAP